MATDTSSIYKDYQIVEADSTETRHIETMENVLTLTRYSIEYYVRKIIEKCDEPDGTGVWRTIKTNWRACFRRDDISAVHLYYMDDIKVWNLSVEINGTSLTSTIQLYFAKHQDAMPLYGTLREFHLLHKFR